MSDSLPRYFHDATGFCYNATALLATQPGLVPFDGEIDHEGYAIYPTVQAPAADPAPRPARKKAKGKAAESPPSPVEPLPETDTGDDLDDMLGGLKLE